jgi:serine phosphatase RsbU (regulator of sigma subunit)
LIADGVGKAAPLRLITGPLLGVHRHTYEVVQSTLTRGARLVFYTDGLVDIGRTGADQQLSQLVRSVESHRSGQCGELADAILYEQIEQERSYDDIALLVVEWTGPPSGAG